MKIIILTTIATFQVIGHAVSESSSNGVQNNKFLQKFYFKTTFDQDKLIEVYNELKKEFDDFPELKEENISYFMNTDHSTLKIVLKKKTLTIRFKSEINDDIMYHRLGIVKEIIKSL